MASQSQTSPLVLAAAAASAGVAALGALFLLNRSKGRASDNQATGSSSCCGCSNSSSDDSDTKEPTPFHRLAAADALNVKPDVNRQIVLKRKANGLPTLANFELKSTPLPQPNENEVLVRTLWLSVDPYIRGRIGSDKNKASTTPLDVGQVIVGGSVGEVVESRHPGFKKGDKVVGYGGWQEYYVMPAARLQLIPADHGLPLEKYIGSLGMPGLTAYYGLINVGKPKAGETLVVSAAAGAVGSVVCQIGKILGLKVIAIAGSADKLKYLRDTLHVDGVINYKTDNIGAELDKLCPEGVDIYFDNTGGDIFDQVLLRIRVRARILICGQIGDYNAPDGKPRMGPRLNYMLLWKRAKIEGFLVNDFASEDTATINTLAKWMKEGKLQSTEDYEYGLEAVPIAFLKLFEGANFGKQVIKIANY